MSLRSTLSVLAGCLLWAACGFSQESSTPLGDVMRQPKAAKKAKVTLTDDDLASSKPKAKAAAHLQAAATDADTGKSEADAKPTPPDSTDTAPVPAEQVEEPSGPQTSAQTAARADVKDAQDQVNFLGHNVAMVQSKIDGETDEGRKQALKDMLSNYSQQMGDAKRQLERAQQDLQRANQQASRE
jgi:hypothetical protein